MTYNTAIYCKQGGAELVVASGGTLTTESGGTMTLGGTTNLTGGLSFEGTAVLTDVAFDRLVKVARVALAAVDTAGGVFAWQNPEAVGALVTNVLLDVTTQTSGACTIDVGMTATNATTLADNLIDGKSLATAGLFDNIEDQGTNGTSRQKVAAGKWITGSVASGASAGIVGFAYIFYVTV